jgi:surfeit locus 1 family protein
MRPKFLVLTLFAGLGLVILLALGFWQLERRAWKHDLIARIDARAQATPVDLSRAIRQWRDGESVEFLRVRLAGVLHTSAEFHYYNVIEGQLGWQVISPLVTDDGTTVLLDRGFVPDRLKDPRTRSTTPQPVNVSLTGRIRLPDERGTFTPNNNLQANQWYWRDIDSMASTLPAAQRATVAPFFVQAEAESLPGEWPRSQSAIPVPNDRHLSYALTWFGLALTLVLVYGAFIAARIKSRQS